MFYTTWMKAGILDAQDKQVLDEIGLLEQTCSDFNLQYATVDGKWGIWLYIDGRVLLVHPLDLVSSIYKDNRHFMDILTADQWSGCEICIRKTQYSYEWSMLNTELSLCQVVHFKFSDYVEKIAQAIATAHQAYATTDCASIYEDGGVTPEVIEMCHKQLQIEALHPSHNRLMTDKVREEAFVFDIFEDDDELYRIGVGDRCYKTWFTHWDNCLETIRHQFELLIYTHISDIELSNDHSNTTLQIQFVNVLDKIKPIGDSVGFDHKEYAVVKILPNQFVDMPVIAGYCDRKQLVRTLYEGLLSLALQYPIEDDDYGDGTRLEAYAKIKSPLIEQYIKEEMRDCNTAQPRDARVKDAILISPNYDSLGNFMLSDNAPIDINTDGLIENDNIYDKHGKHIVMPELYEWQHEIEPVVIASETGNTYTKDWEDYHKRGLAIAHKLRKVLSADFDLWYSAPFEDKSRSMPHKMLIL